MPFGSEQWMYASGSDFTLDQSLRFDTTRKTYLAWTPGTPTNQKIWTLSFWTKSTVDLTGNNYMLAAGTSGTQNDTIQFSATGQINFGSYSSGYTHQLITTANYRDPSAWYHYLITLDTTQAVEANRLKLYVNGEQVTDFSTANYPSLNSTDGHINAAELHQIGKSVWHDGGYVGGYLAEYHFIDGTALTPTSFGETGDYGEWKPKEVSGLTYGTNGFYLSFAGGGVMTATGGNSTATDGDYKAASFTADGTFTPSADGFVEYLVIAGGGGGGSNYGGGGGAGGYRTGYLQVTASTAYSITVGAGGAGGAGSSNSGADGNNSIFSTITSDGGGGGGAAGTAGRAGGSGGGAGTGVNPWAGGTATTGQGNAGGYSNANGGAAGGGGAGAVGANHTSNDVGRNGGAGLSSSITGSAVTRAGGGGGGGYGSRGIGGSGGGGTSGSISPANTPTVGTANTGGGGAGSGNYGSAGSNGGSGIVILRYKFQ
jgi:hypothetical protein